MVALREGQQQELLRSRSNNDIPQLVEDSFYVPTIFHEFQLLVFVFLMLLLFAHTTNKGYRFGIR